VSLIWFFERKLNSIVSSINNDIETTRINKEEFSAIIIHIKNIKEIRKKYKFITANKINNEIRALINKKNTGNAEVCTLNPEKMIFGIFEKNNIENLKKSFIENYIPIFSETIKIKKTDILLAIEYEFFEIRNDFTINDVYDIINIYE